MEEIKSECIYPSFERDAINVFITKNCQRRCSYCGINEVFDSEGGDNDIDLENYEIILNYCEKSNIKKIRILGAEPTQHKRIVEIIKYTYMRGFIVSSFFTNGIFDNNELIECLYRLKIPVVMNYFRRSELKNDEYKLIRNNMKRLFSDQLNNGLVGKKFAYNPGGLSITFTGPEDEFDYIIQAAVEHNIHSIRMSPAHPSRLRKNKYVDLTRLKSMKELFINFIAKCAQNRIRVILECVLVPCIFTRAELDFIQMFLIKTHMFRCFPLLDVYPDLKVRYCFGLPIESNLLDYRTFEEIFDEQLRESIPFRLKLAQKECKDCQWWQHALCQGYCLNAK